MTNALERVVCELADREAVREMPSRYCDASWRNSPDDIAELFTEDGAMIVEGPLAQTVRGRAMLRKTYHTLSLAGLPRSFAHNQIVRLEGPDKAVGTGSLELRTSGDSMNIWAFAYYNDQYRKVDGVWKFQERRITIIPQTSSAQK